MATFKTRQVTKEAIRWEGGDHEVLNSFCGKNWGRADAVSDYWPSDISDTEQVMVFNSAEQTWLPVPKGWWIIRGVAGELYPCHPDIFQRTYEPA